MSTVDCRLSIVDSMTWHGCRTHYIIAWCLAPILCRVIKTSLINYSFNRNLFSNCTYIALLFRQSDFFHMLPRTSYILSREMSTIERCLPLRTTNDYSLHTTPVARNTRNIVDLPIRRAVNTAFFCTWSLVENFTILKDYDPRQIRPAHYHSVRLTPLVISIMMILVFWYFIALFQIKISKENLSLPVSVTHCVALKFT